MPSAILRNRCLSACFVLLAVLLSFPGGFAQQSGCRLEGTVRDSQGLVIPGVLVVAGNQETNVAHETYTNDSGIYFFPSLLPGLYTISAELTGFRKTSVSNFQLEIATTKVANLTLSVGNISETVTVTAESIQQVQLSTSDLGNVVSEKQIKELPLNGRRPVDLVFLEPGMAGRSAIGSRTGNNALSMDGIDITSSEYGTSTSSLSVATDVTLSVDTIEEFRVTTANPSAEYGRSSGFQVDIATKSGTNRLKGSVYEFFRGRVLNANGFWNNANPLTAERRALTRHQFGGTLGGPVEIPWLYKGRNRTFFFFNYEGQRQSETIALTRTVLTKEMREGIYRFITSGVTRNPETGAVMTQNNRVVVDPVTGAIRPGVEGIQVLNFGEADKKYYDGIGLDQSGLIKKLQGLTPLPNDFSVAFGAGDGLNTAGYRFRAPAFTYYDNYTIKIDHTLSNSHTLSFRTLWGKSDRFGDTANSYYQSFPDGYNPPRLERQISASLSLISRVKPTVTNDFRIGVNRNRREFPDTLKLPGVLYTSIGTYPGITNPVYTRNSFIVGRQTEQLSDNLIWMKSKHSIKTGFQAHSMPINTITGSMEISMNFSASTSSLGGALVNIPQLFGNPNGSNPVPSADRTQAGNLFNWATGRMGAAWAGYNAVSTDAFGPIGSGKTRGFRSRDYGFFFQDDWKFRKNLTLNLGFRYDFFQVPWEVNSFFVIPDRSLVDTMMDPSLAATMVGFNAVGPKYGSRLFNNDLNNFAPVVGFSWDPFGKNKTAIRGSYRISYDHLYSISLEGMEGSVPGLNGEGSTNGDTLARTAGLINAFGQLRSPRLTDLKSIPTYLGTPVGSGAIDLAGLLDIRKTQKPLAPLAPERASLAPYQFEKGLVNPYSQSWSLGIQHEILKHTILEVRYVGRKGTKEYASLPANQIRAPQEMINGFRELQGLLMMTRGEAYAKAGLPLPGGVSASSATTVADFYGATTPTSATSITQWKAGPLAALMPKSQMLFHFFLAGTATLKSNVETAIKNNNLVTALSNLDATGPFQGNAFLVSAGFKPVPDNRSSRGWLPQALGYADNLMRPNPQFLNGPRLTANAAYSSYQGMQLVLRRRFSKGSQGEFNYTLSKNLDITATNDPAGGTDVLDFFQRNVSKGISANDITHYAKFNFVYELPFGPGKWFGKKTTGLAAKLIGGWQVSTIGSFYSGAALSPYYGNINSGFQTATRPDMVPGVKLTHDKTRIGEVRRNGSGQLYYFTAEDFNGLFQWPKLGTIGNGPNGWLRGPGAWELDLGFTKNLKLHERWSVQLRGEFFNVFNHMNPGDPTTNMDSTNFGVITSGSAGRVIQLAAKIYF